MITKITKAFIPYKSFTSYLNGGPGRIKTESLVSHGFVWEKGTILFMTCNGQPINEAMGIKGYITFDTHKNDLKTKEKKEVKKVVTLQYLKNVKDNTERQ